jgi:hypothetical protein
VRRRFESYRGHHWGGIPPSARSFFGSPSRGAEPRDDNVTALGAHSWTRACSSALRAGVRSPVAKRNLDLESLAKARLGPIEGDLAGLPKRTNDNIRGDKRN